MQTLLDEIGGENFYYTPELQRDAGFAFSELVGFSCIQRRNFATLEALRWGADLIVSIDDDNFPLNSGYFADFEFATARHGTQWSGLQATSQSGWVDPGQFLLPPVEHRGFPHEVRSPPVLSPIVDARVGVAQGLVLGDPDIGASLRLASAPHCHGVHEVARAGFVVDPSKSWTVFNSQNTAIIRELAPAFFMLPGVGRYDDLFASLICQWIMRGRGYVTHYGPPFVYQERNKHNLVRDLKDELWGMQFIRELATHLDCNPLDQNDTSVSVSEILRCLFIDLTKSRWFPEKTARAGLAWCDDVERVL